MVAAEPIGAGGGQESTERGPPTEVTRETYESLRRLAARYLSGERPNHTLQATALLHEALLRVLKQPESSWRNEAHLISFAGRAMRRILISYGVARTRDKRGGRDLVKLPLDEALDFCVERNINIAAVDDVIVKRLGARDVTGFSGGGLLRNCLESLVERHQLFRAEIARHVRFTGKISALLFS